MRLLSSLRNATLKPAGVPLARMQSIPGISPVTATLTVLAPLILGRSTATGSPFKFVMLSSISLASVPSFFMAVIALLISSICAASFSFIAIE